MAAPKQSGRVSSISLTVKSSLMAELSAIEGPFSELEDLILLSRDSLRLTLPSTFRWGPRLRRLYSTRITFPSLLQLLLSDLVDLQLHELLSPWHFHQKPSRMPCPGRPSFDHFRSISFLPKATLAYPYYPANTLFSLLSPALISEVSPRPCGQNRCFSSRGYRNHILQ